MSKLSSAQYTFNNLFPVSFGIKIFLTVHSETGLVLLPRQRTGFQLG